MVTVQAVPETVSQPVHPRKTLPNAGVAVSVTTVSRRYEPEQVVPQSIWVALSGLDVEVTVPLPIPAIPT
jgi:hypothetical protein